MINQANGLLRLMEATGKLSKGVVSVILNREEISAFDLEGRLIYYTQSDATYRRSIYNDFYKLDWMGNERVVERVNEPSRLADRAYEVAKISKDLVENDEIRQALGVISARDRKWLESDSVRAKQLYQYISIVPPDQYFSIYLQLTAGCSWNKCSFCKLYTDRPYTIKTIEEFRKHTKAVKEYLGRGFESRKGVFLGDANAINVKNELLIEALEVVKEEFALPVYSFVDAFTTPKNISGIDFKELGRLGLKRVYLGLESGSAEVLKVLNKPMRVEEATDFVARLKRSGIGVAVIILVGAGGYKLWKEHVQGTIDALVKMELDKRDIVYLSPLVEQGSYLDTARELNLGILSKEDKARQMDELTSVIRGSRKTECPIARYNIIEAFLS